MLRSPAFELKVMGMIQQPIGVVRRPIGDPGRYRHKSLNKHGYCATGEVPIDADQITTKSPILELS
jgi:hypothetical protein